MPDILVDRIAAFAVFCALNFEGIVVATALVSLIMATVLLLIRRAVLREENWILYLGLAFGTFFLQYGLRAFAAWVRAGDYATDSARAVEVVAQLFVSNLSSLLFLLAALSLLYRLPKTWWRSRWQILVLLFLTSAALSAWLPRPFDRYVDTALSAVCLLILSWAMYISSGTRQQRGWARLSLIVGGGYAALYAMYAYVPTFAQWPQIQAALNTKLANYASDTAALPPVEMVLDAGIFAVAFIFKLTVFVTALLVIMRSLAAFSPSISRAVLEPVKTSRGEFLTADGIVSAMGQSIGADRAALYLRLPGTTRDQLLALQWAYAGAQEAAEPTILRRPSRNESALGMTLSSDDIVWSRDRRTLDERGDHDEMRSFVNVPLVYHGATVGALCFDWKRPNGFTATDVQRARQIADFVTPVVQTERWLRAMADLRDRLQHYNFTSVQLERGSFMSRIVHELHDILGTHGTILQLDFGFTYQWAMEHAVAVHSSDDSEEDHLLPAVEERFMDDLRQIETSPLFDQIPLSVSSEAIGKLTTVVSHGHDPVVRPTLAREKRHMESVAGLVKDVIFDLHQRQFTGIVQRLHAALDSRGFASEAHWMRTVREAAAAAGLREIGVRPGGSRIHRDVPPAVTISIEDLHEILPREDATRYRVYQWQPDHAHVQSVIEVPLASSEETLYFAAPRAGFGRELNADLPWRLFLDRLAVAVDASLVRIRALELEADAMQFEMNDLLVHELKNYAENFRMGVEWMEESLFADLQRDDRRREMLSQLRASSQKFLELAHALTIASMETDADTVSLGELRQRVGRFYEDRLAARAIDLGWTVQNDLIVAVPVHLAYLVVVSLIQNCRDAIGKSAGRIELTSETAGDAVLLHVDDDGVGIPATNRDRIFSLGFTTKPRGSGRGLSLVRRALNRYGGDLTLDEAPPGMSTRFTIRFPKEH